MVVGIGILNRSAVVLAADAFDTVQIVGGASKFVSINRIFPLSKYHPVGIMLDGSVRFMDRIPWEAIIEVYRSYIGDKSFDTLQEYAKDFIQFLPNDNRFYSSSAEMNLIKYVFNYCLNKVRNGNEKAISDEVEKQIINFSKKSFLNTFDDNFIKLFLEKHRKGLNEYIKNSKDDFVASGIPTIDEKTQENLITMCAYVISKSSEEIIDRISLGSVVISGYGEKEIFPSLYRYKIVGAIDGKLIYKLDESYNIKTEEDEDELRKKIIPFGEQENLDLLNTYINGINPTLENTILKEFNNIFDNFIKEIQNKYNKNDVLYQLIDKEKDKINNIGIMVMEGFKKYIKDLQQIEFVNPLLYMVDVIRKEDMITLAETLVNLTAISAKFQANKEAEVGPIDVAFITKGDGFVSIRRK